ncbi:hypothetical protein ACFL5O_04345 [Myxococcota bacterium]
MQDRCAWTFVAPMTIEQLLGSAGKAGSIASGASANTVAGLLWVHIALLSRPPLRRTRGVMHVGCFRGEVLLRSLRFDLSRADHPEPGAGTGGTGVEFPPASAQKVTQPPHAYWGTRMRGAQRVWPPLCSPLNSLGCCGPG